ncbi:hypothetical protein [Nocardia jejuensis]|nr:hypothetical protein [Nocardia jejuensis]
MSTTQFRRRGGRAPDFVAPCYGDGRSAQLIWLVWVALVAAASVLMLLIQ